MTAILEMLSLSADIGYVIAGSFRIITGYDSFEDLEATRYHARRLAREAGEVNSEAPDDE